MPKNVGHCALPSQLRSSPPPSQGTAFSALSLSLSLSLSGSALPSSASVVRLVVGGAPLSLERGAAQSRLLGLFCLTAFTSAPKYSVSQVNDLLLWWTEPANDCGVEQIGLFTVHIYCGIKKRTRREGDAESKDRN